MYTLHLTCVTSEIDEISAQLWECGTVGVQELDLGGDSVSLIASFETNRLRETLLEQFRAFSPQWRREPDTNWILETQNAWPGRAVGHSLFLAPPWCRVPTPQGRHRVIHNPGLACGTGEHPCTRLALQALEQAIFTGCSVADIGTGSGVLAIVALYLGAATVIAFDTDEQALQAARQNFLLNNLQPNLFSGSTDALAHSSFDIAVANINASVLFSLADDLLRILRPGGELILTGFPKSESSQVAQLFPPHKLLEEDNWLCLISTCP